MILHHATPQAAALAVARAASSRVGRPYVWGAAGPWSFDCSGLVQWAYRRAGRHLPRTTWTQRARGIHVRLRHVKVADVVFSSYGAHEGLYAGHGTVIEAPHAGADVRRVTFGSFVARPGFAGIRRYIKRHP